MSDEPTRCLLIVDDQVELLRMLKRSMGPYFREVLTASTPAEAEAHLRAARPDTLLCDYCLGDDVPTGTELVARWRADFDSLRQVFLITGSDLSSLAGTNQVDRVFRKPLDLPLLMQALFPATEDRTG